MTEPSPFTQVETAPRARGAARQPLASRIVRAADLAMAPPAYVIDGVLFCDSLAALVGPPAAYKTLTALAMAAAIHTGQPFAGCATLRGPVLYLVAEGAAGLRRRLRALEVAHGADLHDLWLLPAATNLLDSTACAALEREVAALSPAPALIVVDTLARHFGGDENAAGDMGRFIVACDRLRTLTGACVLVIHHEGKAGGYRGSSSFEGGLDTLIAAQRKGNTVTLKNLKQKEAEVFAPIRLTAREVCIGADEQGERVTSLVLELAAESADARPGTVARDRPLNANEQVALAVLRAVPDQTLAYGAWLHASGVPSSSFERVVKHLVSCGLVCKLARGSYRVPPPTPESPPDRPHTSPPPLAPTPTIARSWGVGAGGA